VRSPRRAVIDRALRRAIKGACEAGFAAVEELLVRGEGGIERIRREWRWPVAGHQVLHNPNRLDHCNVAIPDCRDGPGRMDGQKLSILLNAGQ
jgi:hypothetical protein